MIRRIWALLTETEITAGQHPVYDDIQPMIFRGEEESILRMAREAFEQGGTLWQVHVVDPQNRKIEGTITSPLLRLVEDFTVWLEESEGKDQWKLMARSSSRTGFGDFGKNARNLKQFYSRVAGENPNDYKQELEPQAAP